MAQAEETASHVAERANESVPHTASLSLADIRDLLCGENAHERFEYYSRVVRAEQLHDYHYPDALGPPNPSQPCAQLLKGTLHTWCRGNGYPAISSASPAARRSRRTLCGLISGGRTCAATARP